MFQFLGAAPPAPADLTGTSGSVVLGTLAGTPVDGDAGAYSGTSDLDWWYLVDPSTINAARLPNSTLNGSYTSKELNAGPGNLGISLILQGSLANLQMWNAQVKAAIGGTSAPKTSTGLPPGHLAAEHDKAGLVSFGSTTGGELCGDITAQSLKAVNVPAQIAVGGSTACSQKYVTGTNSLLDVLVGGCTVLLSVVNATQPDQQNAAVTFPTGTVAPYKLSASGTAGAKVVDTCKDSKGTVVPLATCLTGLGYSSAFDFATDRVIVK